MDFLSIVIGSVLKKGVPLTPSQIECLLARPNPKMTGHVFNKLADLHQGLVGSCCAWVLYDEVGSPKEIYLLEPWCVVELASGGMVYIGALPFQGEVALNPDHVVTEPQQ